MSIEVFGAPMQLMGYHLGWRKPPPLAELERRCEEVLSALEAIQAGSVSSSGEPGGERYVCLGGSLTLRCVEGEGIVARMPMADPAYRGATLRTPRVNGLVEAFGGGGPISGVMEDILKDAWEWDGDRCYEFGQGGEHGLMYQLEFTSEAPGPQHKHMTYRCTTVAELACFLDEVLGTYAWDSICARASPIGAVW
jgi:hypothetical protein